MKFKANDEIINKQNSQIRILGATGTDKYLVESVTIPSDFIYHLSVQSVDKEYQLISKIKFHKIWIEINE